MAVQLTPYLSFHGDARAAMEHYRDVLGGTLELSSYADFGMAQDPADADEVMHGQLRTEDGMVLMGADAPGGAPAAGGGGHSVSLSGGPEDEARLRGAWDGLVDGGTVVEPLEKAPWGDLFGMCVDRHRVGWMVNIGGQ